MHKEAIRLAGELESKGYYGALQALYFAAEIHAGQKRDDGTDYLDHPVGVARIILNMNIEPDPTKEEALIIDALLHDVVEEKGVLRDILCRLFGEERAEDTLALSKTKRTDPDDYYGRLSREIRLIIVKGADRLHNIGNMAQTYTLERLEKYAKETRERVKPMLKMARRRYPRYGKTMVVFRDIINGILACVERIVRAERDNEKLRKKKIPRLAQMIRDYAARLKQAETDLDTVIRERDDLRERLAALTPDDIPFG